MATTREHIMDVAERLFAERGVGVTSLRSIMTAAEVNAAAIAYHFGSKEDLIREILKRRLRPINEERLKRLTRLEAPAQNDRVSANEILEAFFAPALRLLSDRSTTGSFFIQFLGRLYSEAGAEFQSILQEHFGEVMRRFTTALRRSLPEISSTQFNWRFFFMLGALAHTMMSRSLLEWISAGRCDASDTRTLLKELVTFAAGGLNGTQDLGRRKKMKHER